MNYQFIAAAQLDYPVSRLCTVLDVSASGYYAWKQHPQSLHAREDGLLKNASMEVDMASKERYGSPRIHAELRDQGYRCSRKRVARLMREEGLCAREPAPSGSHDPARSVTSQGRECSEPEL